MASRRDLKRVIEAISEELIATTFICDYSIPGLDSNKICNIIDKIIDMRQEFKSRISHTEPGNVKGYYKGLIKDLNESIVVIQREIESLKG